MHELRIPFDPCNPGQYYACCGLIELFELFDVEPWSRFEVDWRRPRIASFIVQTSSGLDMAAVVERIRVAEYQPLRRPGGDRPEQDPIAPIAVTGLGRHHVIDWWLSPFRDQAAAWKCWAGQLTVAKLFTTLPALLPLAPLAGAPVEESSEGGLFNSSCFASTRFGVDPRSAWVAIDLGYSANTQGQEARTFPLVEVLAAFGLQTFRPAGNRSSGFSYSLWLHPLPALVARTASAKPWDGLPALTCSFDVQKRGSYKYFTFAQPQTQSKEFANDLTV
jgi:CRISPR-associated protein Csx14